MMMLPRTRAAYVSAVVTRLVLFMLRAGAAVAVAVLMFYTS